MFNRKRKPSTKAEKAHIERVKLSGCVCCTQLDPPVAHYLVEFNHHVGARGRFGHDVGTGECTWHHRGEPEDGMTKAAMLLVYGPSRKYPGSRPFHARFGSDAELLERQTSMLKVRYG